MLFGSCSKLFLFLYLNFCPELSDNVGKRLNKEAKDNFKMCNVTD